MKYLSVCSGIEAASVAWHPLGWEPLAFAEIEPFPRAVLQHHYPEVPLHGDFTELRHQPWIVDADILVGGTPCQSFSVAGLRNSLDDQRGNLTLEFIRLANAIDDLRCDAGREPAFLLWENVPGVFSTKDNAFGAFLGGVVGSGAALDAPNAGWPDAGVVSGPERVAAWRILDAQHFGLAQRRRRVFVLARRHSGGWACADALLPIIDSLSGHPAPRREAGEDVAPSVAKSVRANSGGIDREDMHTLIPDIVGTLSDGAHMGGGLTGRTPTQAASLPSLANTLTQRMHKGINTTCDEGQTLIPTGGVFDVAHSLRADGFDASEDGTGRGTPLVPICWDEELNATEDQSGSLLRGGDGGRHAGVAVPAVAFAQNQRGELRTSDVVPALNAGGGKPGEGYPAVAFDARQSDVIQYGEKTGPLDTDGHSMAVALNFRGRDGGTQAELGDDVATALRCAGGTSSKSHAMVGMQVRRLTPVECARLQGFPDTYLDITYRGKPAADGNKYKALGNSFAVPVMAWIGQRIQLVADIKE
jgi:DNA (cytosine-5)-methyltransferase 1